uniref:recombinase family protein n=1 Tax=Polaribacter sp. TaxID=1920175 RepID=UPI004047D94A
MKVGVYCRVSSENQKDNSSLESQKELGIKFCKDKGFEYEVFSEVVSGVKMGDEREVFLKLEEKIFDGEIGGIWLYDWDRMIRDVEVMLYFRKLVEDNDIRVFVGFEEKNILEGSGELEYGLSSVFSEYWKRKLVRVMKEGRNKRWREGRGLGNIGFGFESVNGEVSLKEEECEVIRDMYRFFLYKNVKKYGDVEKLIESKYGIRVNGKRVVYNGLISRVLGNKKYNGELIFDTEKDGEFRFELEKVVSDDEFEAVVEKLKFVKGIRKGNSKEIYLLKGKVCCDHCGKKMWIEGSGKMINGKSYRYFRCSSYKEFWKNKRRGIEIKDNTVCESGLRGNKISKDKLDEIVWNGLFRILVNSDFIIKDFKKRYNSEVGLKDRFIGKKGYYEKELKKLTERKNKIMNLYLDGEVSDVDYKDWIKNEFEVSKKEIEKKKKGIDNEIVKYGYVDKIDSWMDYMKEEILKDYYIERKEDKKRIVDNYVDSVFVREIIEEGKKRFEVKMGVRLGKERGNVVFDVNKKRLNLKDRDNQFYILNDDLVAGTGLEPVTFGL